MSEHDQAPPAEDAARTEHPQEETPQPQGPSALEAEELEDRSRRALADPDNLRKRYARDRARELEAERARATAAWLPVVDNLELWSRPFPPCWSSTGAGHLPARPARRRPRCCASGWSRHWRTAPSPPDRPWRSR